MVKGAVDVIRWLVEAILILRLAVFHGRVKQYFNFYLLLTEQWKDQDFDRESFLPYPNPILYLI